MTQSPFGGTASPSIQPSPSGSSETGSEFGATTISGAPTTSTATDDRAEEHTAVTPRIDDDAPTESTNRPFQASPPPPVAPYGAPQRPPVQAPARGRGARGPRRARLQLRHISPLTVLKFSCVLAIALFFVWLIIVGVLYGVLDAAGVVQNVNDAYGQLNGPGTKAPITAGIVFGGAAIVGVVNIILFVALTTIGSVIYNLCADLVGGIEITLSER